LLLAEEVGQLQPIGCGLIEQDGEGVAENLAQQSASEMPGVPSLDALGVVALSELAEDGVDAIAQMAQDQVPARVRVAGLVARRGNELDALGGQLSANPRRVVVAVPA
jgi:hypothetical protein